MKNILRTAFVLLTTVAVKVQAADVEIGKYKAVDADSKTIQASFELKSDNTLTFNVKTPDFTMPAPGCTGKYTVKGNEFSAELKCPTQLLPQASVKIDITNVTTQSLRSSAGAEVMVQIDALGGEKTKFLLKKADVEVGRYTAIDADTKTIKAQFLLKTDGTVVFTVKTPDFTMPEPGCTGTYSVDGSDFAADLKCPTQLLPQASVKIDISTVNFNSIRSETGAEVMVQIDALGGEKTKFLLKKADVEVGKYSALDADTKTIKADFELRADGTLTFNVKTPDFTMPAPGCTGKYGVKGSDFLADLTCPTQLLPKASVKIDIRNVNAETLRSASGAEVLVVIDALGAQANKFLLKKAD